MEVQTIASGAQLEAINIFNTLTEAQKNCLYIYYRNSKQYLLIKGFEEVAQRYKLRLEGVIQFLQFGRLAAVRDHLEDLIFNYLADTYKAEEAHNETQS